jgi:hypothetical protein
MADKKEREARGLNITVAHHGKPLWQVEIPEKFCTPGSHIKVFKDGRIEAIVPEKKAEPKVPATEPAKPDPLKPAAKDAVKAPSTEKEGQ